jgi:uncharacterized membrane protein
MKNGLAQFILACLIIMSCFGIMVVLIKIPPVGLDAAWVNVICTLLGMLFGYAGACVTYYFGSSKGSSDKQETINTLSQATADANKP